MSESNEQKLINIVFDVAFLIKDDANLREQSDDELAGTEAEARKAVVEAKGKADALMLTAKAQAEANRILAESLTPELIKYEAIKMWDGKMPVVMSGEGSSMLINPDTVLPKS